MSNFNIMNEVVLASAGSGKTFQLSDRIIKLLASEPRAKPEEIVALTFTRAAAGEFISKTLSKLAGAASDAAEAKQLQTRLQLPASCDQEFFLGLLRTTLLSMHRLNLGTLDSFYARLVVNNPTEVGLDGGQVQTMNDIEAAEARLQVISALLQDISPENIESFWDVSRYIFQGKNVANPIEQLGGYVQKLHDLVTLANNTDKWGNEGRIWPNGVPKLFVAPTEAEINNANNVLRVWLENLSPVENRTRKHISDHFGKLLNFQKTQKIKREEFEKICDEEKYWRVVEAASGSFAEISYYKKLIRFTAEAAAAYQVLARNVFSVKFESKLNQTRAIYGLLKHYETMYAKIVRQPGRLTFSDNVTLLLNAPNKEFNIDYRLDCRIRHWLFDEFQDTSTRQWKVLENNLTEIIDGKSSSEPRSVFFVGDLKQSLYGWRAGNPQLLSDVNKKINREKKEGSRLDFTYRCSVPVVDMVNTLLGNLTPYGHYFSPRAAAKWNDVFGKHESRKKNHRDDGHAMWVRLNEIDEETAEGSEADDSGDSTSGTDIARQARWIGRHLQTSGLLNGRLLKPGLTCAVLVSKNAQAAEITEVLRRMGIEAADEANAEIALDNPMTAGIIALLNQAAHPSDGLTAAVAEMSPSSNAYIQQYEGLDKTRWHIAQLFQSKGAEALILDIISGIKLSDEDTKSPLKETEANGRAFLRKRLQQVLSLAVEYDKQGERNLPKLVNFLKHSTLRDTADPRAVQVLTIHRSKGLEYSAVYLPCLNGEPLNKVRDDQPMVQSDEKFTPTWILNRPEILLCQKDPTLSDRLQQEQADSAYENLCRLYVGMTRAEYSLVLITSRLDKSEDKKLNTEEGIGKYNFALLLETVIGSTNAKPIKLTGCAEGEIVWQTGDDNWVKMLGSQKPEEAISQQPVIPAFAPITKIERLRPSAQSHLTASPFRSRTEQAGDNHSGKELGTLVHQLFQNLEWDIESFLGQIQAPAKSTIESFKFARQLIEGCLKSKSVVDLLIPKSSKPELWRERSVALMSDGKIIDAVFDRVHIVPGKEAVIIDYKTNDCSEAHLKELYEGQMKLYRLSVAELCGIPAEKIRCVLIHVRNGTLVEV